MSETEIIQNLLPNHYDCEPLKNGVRCRSNIGIVKESEWRDFMTSLREQFGGRLMEVFHKTCTNHLNFTVYLSGLNGENYGKRNY